MTEGYIDGLNIKEGSKDDIGVEYEKIEDGRRREWTGHSGKRWMRCCPLFLLQYVIL